MGIHGDGVYRMFLLLPLGFCVDSFLKREDLCAVMGISICWYLTVLDLGIADRAWYTGCLRLGRPKSQGRNFLKMLGEPLNSALLFTKAFFGD